MTISIRNLDARWARRFAASTSPSPWSRSGKGYKKVTDVRETVGARHPLVRTDRGLATGTGKS
jgi:hypothetical protein